MLRSKTLLVFLCFTSCLTAFLLAFAIANLCIKRSYPAGHNDPEFKEVSDILVKKCADCHTNDMAEYPVYFNMPIAAQIIDKNISDGRASFLISKAKLEGHQKFSASDIDRLSQAMAKGNMPPLQYLLLHWDAALNRKEQKALVAWIQKRQKEYDIRPIPSHNFFEPDKEKAALGKRLFNETALSAGNAYSCASCHNLNEGGAEHRQVSETPGKVPSRLNAPTVLNAAYNFAQYWDGRARDLKEQTLLAIENPDEMDSTLELVLARLQSKPEYLRLFSRSYEDGITADNIADAISEYERSLLTPGCRFDKYLSGDNSALNEEEKEGFRIFKKHDCASCHAGPALGGLSFERMGNYRKHISMWEESKTAYQGRYAITHKQSDLFKVKVPGLRNLALTAPYFHDGSAPTLEEAVKIMSEQHTDKPLTNAEQKKVCAFLRTLNAPLPAEKCEVEKSR